MPQFKSGWCLQQIPLVKIFTEGIFLCFISPLLIKENTNYKGSKKISKKVSATLLTWVVYSYKLTSVYSYKPRRWNTQTTYCRARRCKADRYKTMTSPTVARAQRPNTRSKLIAEYQTKKTRRKWHIGLTWSAHETKERIVPVIPTKSNTKIIREVQESVLKLRQRSRSAYRLDQRWTAKNLLLRRATVNPTTITTITTAEHCWSSETKIEFDAGQQKWDPNLRDRFNDHSPLWSSS